MQREFTNEVPELDYSSYKIFVFPQLPSSGRGTKIDESHVHNSHSKEAESNHGHSQFGVQSIYQFTTQSQLFRSLLDQGRQRICLHETNFQAMNW